MTTATWHVARAAGALTLAAVSALALLEASVGAQPKGKIASAAAPPDASDAMDAVVDGDADATSEASPDADASDGDAATDSTVDVQVAAAEVHLNDVLDDLSCNDPRIYCIDPTGAPLYGAYPTTVGPKDTIRVQVVGNPNEQVNVTCRLSADGVEPAERRFPGSAADGGTGTNQVSADAALGTWQHWSLLNITLPVPDAVHSFTVRYSCTDNSNGVVTQKNSLVFTVNGGIRYLETGLMVPFIFRGKRNVVGEPISSTGTSSLGVKEDLLVVPALSVTVYPWGAVDERPQVLDRSDYEKCVEKEQKEDAGTADAAIGDGSADGGHAPAPSKCVHPAPTMEPWWKFYLFRRFGLQFGTRLDFTEQSFREWFLGVNYRFYEGASVSVGMAFVQGSFINSNAGVGYTVTDPGPYYSDRYMARPYIALTLSTRALQGILSTFISIENAASGARSPGSNTTAGPR